MLSDSEMDTIIDLRKFLGELSGLNVTKEMLPSKVQKIPHKFNYPSFVNEDRRLSMSSTNQNGASETIDYVILVMKILENIDALKRDCKYLEDIVSMDDDYKDE